MPRTKKLEDFNPDENGLHDFGIFGLPFTPENAQIVLLPIPWEATVSYKEGTANGPDAILKASHQIDLYEPIYPGGWKVGIAMDEIPSNLLELNTSCRTQTKMYLHEYGSSEIMSAQALEILEETNKITAQVLHYVKEKAIRLLEQGKFVGVIGGEHSVPLGYMQALAEKQEYGILQIDAHADLRIAYEGFTHSHASIMYNAMQINNITKLVQVGIRDHSEGEQKIVEASQGRIRMYTDRDMKQALYQGQTWDTICDDIIAQLPQNVYISFDIDGLQPWLCPNTGTPVAGGLLLEEAMYLMEKLADSGKRIIGFDLCEVAPGNDEWDGNVGSRVLYKLCLLAAKNNGMV